MPADEVLFDEVVLLGPTERRLEPSAFFALPLAQRLRHVIARSAVFLRHGEEVDPQVALARVRALRAAS